MSMLHDEGTKELLKFLFALTLACLLFYLGWKK